MTLSSVRSATKRLNSAFSSRNSRSYAARRSISGLLILPQVGLLTDPRLARNLGYQFPRYLGLALGQISDIMSTSIPAEIASMDLDTAPQVILSQALTRYTKRQIAQLLEINPVTVSRWESGANMGRRDALALLYLLDTPKPVQQRASEFRFVDLFAGIGGLRLGFEGVGGECIFTCEFDEACKRTYVENFPHDEHEIFGDIRGITEPPGHDKMSDTELADRIRAMVPEHDVLLAGFPCQPFSLAGVSKRNSLGYSHGFACETQGTLFFDIAKILYARRPKAFLLENVKYLESHDDGKTLRVMMDVLANQLQYKVEYEVRDAKGFVPQHRERVYIVGFREDAGFSWDAVLRPDPAAKVLGLILHPENGTEEPESPYTEGAKARVSEKYVLSNDLWTYLQNYRAKHEKRGNGFGYGLFNKQGIARTLSRRYHKDGSEILIDRGRGKNPRRLTPRECSRLMGFDFGRRRFKIPPSVSDTKAYQQFGNAVVVPVIDEIARVMKQPLIRLIEAESAGVHPPRRLV